MELPDLRPELLVTPQNELSKRIGVIGAGPAGLATFKVISETPQVKSGLWTVTGFEARDKVGGVWNPAPPTGNPPLTPLYDSLTTNIPHPVMAYTSYSFPPSTPLFPEAAVVQSYLKSYAAYHKLTPYIRLNTRVKRVSRRSDRWEVTVLTDDEHEESQEFDFLVVSNGHYSKPRYPDIPGIEPWLAQKRATHSVWYRHPRDLGKIVLIVGGGPSGIDITTEMRTEAVTVIQSIPGTSPNQTGNLKIRGRVMEFLPDGSSVRFEDGTVESGIDHCILATGYEMSFPFLVEPEVVNGEIPPPVPPMPKDLFNTTYSVFPLAMHIFPVQMRYPASSIAFLGLLIRVAPFPLMEAQAHAVVRVIEEPGSLDITRESVDIITRYETLKEREKWDHEQILRGWHKYIGLEQFEYRDQMYEFALKDKVGGPEKVKVPQWVIDSYRDKDPLRRAWKEVVKRGEVDKWVKGVGQGGPHEWVDMMKRLVDWWNEHENRIVEVSRL